MNSIQRDYKTHFLTNLNNYQEYLLNDFKYLLIKRVSKGLVVYNFSQTKKSGVQKEGSIETAIIYECVQLVTSKHFSGVIYSQRSKAVKNCLDQQSQTIESQYDGCYSNTSFNSQVEYQPLYCIKRYQFMVYKIRNKSFFWTRAGWKNNWHPKNFNAPRPSSSEFTIGIRCRYDHNSFLRAYHSYRKISRHCKQYFFGNKELEELFQMGLRTFFIVPHIAECQVTQIKHGGERRMVDQIDRDFELVSYNSHPYQLFTYTVWNQYLANQQEAYEQRKNGGKSVEDQVIDHIGDLVKEEKSKLGVGKQLSIERTAEIVMGVMRQLKAAQQRPNLNNRRADGEFDDFLEQRRPFTAPNNQSATH